MTGRKPSIGARLFLALAVAAGTFAAGPAQAIVGGNVADENDYPYFARVFQTGRSACGGSVIAPGWILTAGHCVDDVGGNAAGIKVRVRGADFPAQSLQIHPLWNGSPEDGHDLALVRVSPTATRFSPAVQVGTMTDHGAYAGDTPATVIGYGRHNPSQSPDGQFRDLHTVLRSDSYMDDIYNKWYWFDNWPGAYAIGAGSSSKTVCFGDSGGPLTVTRHGVILQVGVASFVDTTWDDCDEPGGFAELAGAQLAWVASRVPGVSSRWGKCTTHSGAPGAWSAAYDTTTLSGQKDGDSRYYWKFTCYYTPPPSSGSGSGSGPSPTPTPTPSPNDGAPSEQVCMNKPWTPGCESY